MVVRSFSTFTYRARSAIAMVAMVAIFAGLTPSTAAAAGWNTYSGIQCSGPSEGWSTITWDGYFPASWANITSSVYWWDGSAWNLGASGQNGGNGGSGTVTATAPDSQMGGSGLYWQTQGDATSSFFSGDAFSSTPSTLCP